MEHVETTRETFRKSCYCLCVPKRLGNDGASTVVNIRKKENVIKDVSDLRSCVSLHLPTSGYAGCDQLPCCLFLDMIIRWDLLMLG
ncbi:hypothetical protein AVEN_51793-1 [Araneus ventricosus]|uniref:Uncharacterized protein n=1 Tax=Araneus ventricosus TaxID=182803 RepID=A0A4Y2M5Y8_ARAVE|nr:hypothetical protein AVEN_51793-1 [Araneus ventricosus]